MQPVPRCRSINGSGAKFSPRHHLRRSPHARSGLSAQEIQGTYISDPGGSFQGSIYFINVAEAGSATSTSNHNCPSFSCTATQQRGNARPVSIFPIFCFRRFGIRRHAQFNCAPLTVLIHRGLLVSQCPHRPPGILHYVHSFCPCPQGRPAHSSLRP